jgi:hypothetical protein
MRGADMTGYDPEINELRDKVHCGVVLERTPPSWIMELQRIFLVFH